jgi:hypothetical protein
MWTTISSYIWGDADEQIVPGCAVDDTQSDDDWILVDVHESKFLGKCFVLTEFSLRVVGIFLKAKVSTFLNLFLNYKFRKCTILAYFSSAGNYFERVHSRHGIMQTGLRHRYIIFHRLR